MELSYFNLNVHALMFMFMLTFCHFTLFAALER